jgi:hypothetical protein
LASDLGLDAKTITRVYQRLRMVLFHTVSPTLGVLVRGNEAEVREAKASFLAFWSGTAGSALDTSAR